MAKNASRPLVVLGPRSAMHSSPLLRAKRILFATVFILGCSPLAAAMDAQKVKDDLTSDIASGVAVAVIGWIFITGCSFVTQWYKLHVFLEMVINFHIEKIRANLEYPETFEQRHLHKGHKVPIGLNYTPGSCEELDGVREQCIRLLWPEELRRVVAFCLVYAELETLVDGLLKELTTLYEDGHEFTTDDVEYFHSKIERIRSFRLPKRIDKVLDLPRSYSAKDAKDVVV